MKLMILALVKNTNFHTDFKLNNTSFNSKEALLLFSKSISNSVFSFFNSWFDENEYLEVETSGSTGKPKIIRLLKKHMLNSAKATGQFFELNSNTSALLCLSTDYIAGKMMLVRAMVLGWHLDIIEASSNPLSTNNKYYDFCAMVPMQLYNSFDKLHRIKTLIVGGGAINNEYLSKLNQLSTNVYTTYGMTETSTHIAVKKLNHFSSVKVDSNPPFMVLPNIKISLDSRGCLVIDAPNIAETTIRTNDLIELITDTKFHWLGRIDNIINSGSIKLIPEKIEEKLSQVFKVPLFVIGIPDSYLGEKLVLVIESKKQDDQIIEKIKKLEVLESFEVPKEVFYSDQFLRTETKKIKRRETLYSILKAKGKS